MAVSRYVTLIRLIEKLNFQNLGYD